MILWVLAYFGGLLTILSPCILPVLPFVLSRSEQPFRKSGLPLLVGMAATFAAVSTLAALGGSWAAHANEWGRWLALGFLSLFALSLIFSSVSEWMSRPFTRLGNALHQNPSNEPSLTGSFMLGAATGLLWAPCAGPILGLILAGAAIQGASAGTTFLLLAYALGAATSLAIALLAGNRVFQWMKRQLGAGEWVRKILGVIVLLGVLAIALGWDRGALTNLSRIHTETLEQQLIAFFHIQNRPANEESPATEREMPELDGAIAWINSPPLTRQALRGKVVLVDFWTYSCINCLRSLPYIKAWAQKYKDAGLVVIGVHTPEFAFEKDPANVEKAVKELGVTYPVAVDSHYAIWNAFSNQYWPAHYFIDAQGKIRHTHFGEGEYEESERELQELLAEAGAKSVPTGFVHTSAGGAEAPSLNDAVDSHETYIGYSRAQNNISAPLVKPDQSQLYSVPESLELNQWGLMGQWKVGPEDALLIKAHGKITFRFHARDLHLVLGPGPAGNPVSFIVRLDGQAPTKDHGVDIDEAGHGMIREHRLYQLIRQQTDGAIQDRTFEIEFLDPGAQAFAFTFG